jgi:hypothetical protein
MLCMVLLLNKNFETNSIMLLMIIVKVEGKKQQVGLSI